MMQVHEVINFQVGIHADVDTKIHCAHKLCTYLAPNHVDTLIADVFQSGCNINLFGTCTNQSQLHL